jgi:hypothetical protein
MNQFWKIQSHTLNRHFSRYYLLALLFTGIGYIAFLPPFEGYDETAHFSSIRQIYHTNQIPHLGSSFLDQSIINYSGPIRYENGYPPFNVGNVYPVFFSSADGVNGFIQAYRQVAWNPVFVSGSTPNWQAQHPPLYYLLMSLILPALQSFSFVWQIFFLRLISFGMALIGVALALASISKYLTSERAKSARLGFLFYPLLAPMFFLEFARIGNDSLCLLIAGGVAFLFSKWLTDTSNRFQAIGIGILLGFGLLTKIFFLPIIAGLACYCLIRVILDKRKNRSAIEQLVDLLFVFVPTTLIGGAWYLYKVIVFNDFGVGEEAIRLAQAGGLLSGLAANFSLTGFIRGALVPIVTFGWAGTWSLPRMPAFWQIVLLLIQFLLIIQYRHQLKSHPITDSVYLPVWFVGLMYLGLLWHVFISMALSGLGTSGGWYLHILMPWLAPMFGFGLYRLARLRYGKIALLCVTVFLLAFQVVAIWFQSALFAACAVKGDDKYFDFLGNYFCLDQISHIVARLHIITEPFLAVIFFGLGFTLFVLLIISSVKRY